MCVYIQLSVISPRSLIFTTVAFWNHWYGNNSLYCMCHVLLFYYHRQSEWSWDIMSKIWLYSTMKCNNSLVWEQKQIHCYLISGMQSNDFTELRLCRSSLLCNFLFYKTFGRWPGDAVRVIIQLWHNTEQKQ